jgi:hypothetical protein
MMWTKDCDDHEIKDGATVMWNDPPHIVARGDGRNGRCGFVLGRVKGGWFRVREDDCSETLLIKPYNLRVISS